MLLLVRLPLLFLHYKTTANAFGILAPVREHVPAPGRGRGLVNFHVHDPAPVAAPPLPTSA